MIEVKGIVKRYGGQTAVDHLTFTMEKGKIYGFLGPNGAGKSTTMNIMTGYIAASEGTVTINGADIVRQPKAAKKQIGYLPELPPLYPDMTVLEYLTFVAELKGVPKKERRDQIARVMKMTMLGEFQHKLIRNLSKGYKQRVGLAQALIGFPEVIILDEPTVGLDPQQILEIRDLIRSLKEEHIVMLSSHILSEVNEVCDEVMIISHGRLMGIGTPAELENSMQKSVTVHATVLGSEEAVRAALSEVAQITELLFGEPAEDGSLAVTLKTETTEDIRADIARAFAAGSIPVMGMQLETQSLEEVFLELTSAEAEEAARQAQRASEEAMEAVGEMQQEPDQATDSDSFADQNGPEATGAYDESIFAEEAVDDTEEIVPDETGEEAME